MVDVEQYCGICTHDTRCATDLTDTETESDLEAWPECSCECDQLLADERDGDRAASASAIMKGVPVPSAAGHVRTSGAFWQFAAACSASLMAMTTGCWLGWPSPANKKLLANQTALVVDHEQISWVVSLMDAGSAVSPIPAGYLMDIIGRKSILLLTGMLFTSTWIMAFLAQTPTLLYAARFLAGMGKGVAFTVAPMYCGEIASTGIRGALSTMFACLLWTGTMFEYSIGPFVSYNTLLGLSLIIPVVFLLSFPVMPESPYYLVMRGKSKDANESLRWLRNASKRPGIDDVVVDPVEQELKEMEKNVREEMRNAGSFSDLISSPGNRKATVIVVIASLFQRTCGVSPLLAYSSTTLPETGAFIGPEEIIVVFGVILTVSSFLATPLVDRLGRKPLLVFSGVGCGLSTAAMAVLYYFHEDPSGAGVDVGPYVWVPYACICVFGLAHSIGNGAVPHTLLAELYPQNVKRYAASVAAITFAVSSFIINKVFITVGARFGYHVMFAFFALNGLLCALFSHFIVFETKGKTFAEIQTILRQHAT